jgi:tetratricopeptide (TPR) repeat protein
MFDRFQKRGGAKTMRTINVGKCALLAFVLFLQGCVAYQVGGDIQRGRMELLYGDPKVALGYFERAAELDPDYRLNYTIFPEGVWSYVGRANLAAGNVPEARKALERARTRDEDNLAKVYLGLVMTRQGERDRGAKEIEAGLKGLYEWYDYVQFYHIDGQYWDPGKQLRKSIQSNLAGLTSRGSDSPELVQNIALLGREIEMEIDRAKDHRDLDLMRKHHGDEQRR